MRTWLQPVEYRTGPAGKPRRVHLRRVDLEETAAEYPFLSVTAVAKRALCSVGNVIPCPAGTRVTCPQCLRLAEPFWTQVGARGYARLVTEKLVSEKEQSTEEDE